ncbi:ATP-binding protein [Thermoflexibacter ruber]|uniref:histidine kinase n=1 Tax=Thermoflexibacter ruber TaxID=1003 RepID=A0A1I2J7B1_9BACT|nr:ATP-binding protein [Thermoflexibacter ruber]SFF50249.1 Signal transduction histidine kinase [Thermoflexibacter ruber]
MNLKQRFSILFSLLFSIILGIACFFIYALFADYRMEEFKDRLAEKAETTIKLLLEVQEVDEQLLKIIDQNSIHKLYDEKVLIFNDKQELVYSSFDDAPIRWDKEDLDFLKIHGAFFRTYSNYEVYGMYYDSNRKDYFALVTAEDKYGKRKLDYLKYLLVATFISGTVLVWFLSFYLSKKGLKPLDNVRIQISEITDKNLNIRLPISSKNNEINALSKSFNQMIDRIERAYQSQKEFTGNASHELRTPITRIVTQLENILKTEDLALQVRQTLQRISEDTYQLSDLVSSLLLLSKIDYQTESQNFQTIRLDELIFACLPSLQSQYPYIKVQFEIENQSNDEINLEVKGDENLLKIAISNLLKNACKYSDNQQIDCVICQTETALQLIIRNSGETPQKIEINELFTPFKRGQNAKHKTGSGLGLMIAKRIFQYHQAQIDFEIPAKNLNQLRVCFLISEIKNGHY